MQATQFLTDEFQTLVDDITLAHAVHDGIDDLEVDPDTQAILTNMVDALRRLASYVAAVHLEAVGDDADVPE